MSWRQAKDLRTREVGPGLFDLAELSIPPTVFSESRDSDPGIQLVMTPVAIKEGDLVLTGPLALLAAGTHVSLTWKGRFKLRRSRQWTCWGFLNCGLGRQQFDGITYYHVRTDHKEAGRVVFYFSTHDEAAALFAYLSG